jgi:hypothetical protein
MLQALSFRPEMERQSACNRSVIIFRNVRSGQPSDSNIDARQSLLANPAQACFCEEMEELE